MAVDEYDGVALDASLPRGRCDCTITLRGRHLVARLPTGDDLKLDLRHAELQRGGPGGETYVYTSTVPDGPTLTTNDPRLHEAVQALRVLAPTGASPRRVATRARPRRLGTGQKLVLAGAALVLAAGVTPFMIAGPMAKLAVKAVPTSVDEKLGAEIGDRAAELMSGGRPTERQEPEVRAVIDAIMSRLRTAAPDDRFELRVKVLESSIVNAFALPGGLILVSTGLIKITESPEELAGVLAHEITHVTHRHSVEKMVREAGLGLIAQGLAGNGGSVGRNLMANAALMQGVSFTREMEWEADDDGFVMLRAARIDPAGTARFFERLAEREERMGIGRIPAFMLTHPLTGERIEAIEERLEELPAEPPRPIMADWAAMTKAIAEPPRIERDAIEWEERKRERQREREEQRSKIDLGSPF